MSITRFLGVPASRINCIFSLTIGFGVSFSQAIYDLSRITVVGVPAAKISG